MGVTQAWKNKETHNFTPKTKMALKLYVSGAARTQAEAAEIAGCHKQSVTLARNTPTGRALERAFEHGVMEKAMSLSAVIEKLSAKALTVMEDLIEHGSTEEIQFKAAKDVLDRNPETSKTNKVQVESFTLSGRDAKEIAAALAEGRALQAVDSEVAEGDFVRVQEVSERPSLMEVPDGKLVDRPYSDRIFAGSDRGTAGDGSVSAPEAREQVD